MLARHVVVTGAVLISLLAGCGGDSPRQVVMEGQSMFPTLSDGDRVDVQEYGTDTPRRGDVIVFHPRTESGEPSDRLFLKRIIGLPGETIEIRNEVVLVDGEPLQEPYINEPTAGTFDRFEVPSDEYFVLGDNRNNSSDSRSYLGIPEDYIVGRAKLSN
ncbi:MAG: signal peptidase I [Dehalococcoidia bacterium]